MSKKKVLVVEDEAIIAQDTKLKLESNGYQVVDIVYTGEDALESIKTVKPDIVLMDVLLDGKLDGFETADAIQKQCPTPVLFISAHSEKELMNKAITNPLYKYLVKPLTLEDLMNSIKQLLNHRAD